MTFQYDVEGRLSRAFQTGAPAQGATYAYDPQNRLASRTMTSGATTTTTLYIHDLDDHIIAETNTAGVTLREYVWLNDIPAAVVDGANTAAPVVYYVHTDHLGRPARMIAQSWAWAWDVIYSPFGAPAAIFDATAKLDMRFPGQWFQMESGLAYNWHRHYDASLGRYVQPDPIGYEGGRSLYGYVGQTPLVQVDLSGLKVVVRCGPVMLGSYHCDVNVIPDTGGEGTSFGIGGPEGVGEIGKSCCGFSPPPYSLPASRIPNPDQKEYSARCVKDNEELSDDQAMSCFKQCHGSPPPYYAFWQNSNTYAHNMLRKCGCSISQKPGGAVAW